MILEEKEEFVKDSILSKRYSLILYESTRYIITLVKFIKNDIQKNETLTFQGMEEKVHSLCY